MARRRSRRDVDLPMGSGQNGIGNEEEEDTFKFTIQERASESISFPLSFRYCDAEIIKKIIARRVIFRVVLLLSVLGYCLRFASVEYYYVAPCINLYLGGSLPQ